MIEGSCDFTERRSSLYKTALPGLVTIGIVEMFLISHVNSRDYVFKELCDLMDWSFLWQVTTSPKFCGYSPCGSSDTAVTTFYLTFQENVIKGSGDFMEGKFSFVYLHPTKVGSHRHCVNGYITWFVTT